MQSFTTATDAGCQAVALTWKYVRRLRGGSGRVRVDVADETQYREVSADTRRLLLSVRHGAGDDDLILGMRRNQIAARVGGAARQAGLGPGYSGDCPRLGMKRDVETLGVHLLGGLRRRQRGLGSVSPERRRASSTWDSS